MKRKAPEAKLKKAKSKIQKTNPFEFRHTKSKFGASNTKPKRHNIVKSTEKSINKVK